MQKQAHIFKSIRAIRSTLLGLCAVFLCGLSSAHAGPQTTFGDTLNAASSLAKAVRTNPKLISAQSYLKTTLDYQNPLYLPSAAERNGTVVIRTPILTGPFAGFGSFCSGTVIDATHILTAAHCVSDAFLNGDNGTPNIRFGGSNPGVDNRQDAYNAYIHPSYFDPLIGNGALGAFAAGDIAVVTLSTPVPLGTKIYGLYRDNALGQIKTDISYGTTGNGDGSNGDIFTGLPADPTGNLAVGRKGTNTYELSLRTLLGLAALPEGSQLLSDFDRCFSLDGQTVSGCDPQNNGFDFWLSNLSVDPNTGLIVWTPGQSSPAFQSLIDDYQGTGLTESLIAPGDSGGGAFINDLVAGVHSFGFTLGGPYCDGVLDPNPLDPFDTGLKDLGDPSLGFWNPEIAPIADVDCELNSTFGEIAGDTSVAYYADWIQSVLDGTVGSNAVLVPEPAALAFMGLGMLGLVNRRRRLA